MTLTMDDVQRLMEARVVDSKGEKIGRIERAHVLRGTLVGVRVRLDEVLARLPTVSRDHLELAPDFLDEDRDGDVHLRMDFMDAVTGHAIPRARGGRGATVAEDASPTADRALAREGSGLGKGGVP